MVGPRPNLWTRLRALRQGERDAGVLEALRQAGRAAHQEQLLADQMRAELSVAGQSIWQATAATQARLLAAWSATAWQTLSESVLDTVYAVDPRTAGYVPPETFDQVWRWLNVVEQWLVHARAATTDPQFDITAAIQVPTSLQVGPVARNTSRPHRHAMAAAVPTARQLAEAAVYTLEIDTPTQYEAELRRIRSLAGQAAVLSDYLVGLHPALDNEELHPLIDERVRTALDMWVTVGQIAAMPALLPRLSRRARSTRGKEHNRPTVPLPRPQIVDGRIPGAPERHYRPPPLGSGELPEIAVGGGSAVLPLRLASGVGHTVGLHIRGDTRFLVSTRSADGSEIAVLADSIGDYRGVLPLDLGVVPVALRIDAATHIRWRVTIDRVSAAPEWTGLMSGVGPAVLRIPSRYRLVHTRIRVRHAGSDTFRIIAHTDRPERLVDEVGTYRGSVVLPTDTHTLQIEADGSWSISLPSTLAD
ncbi:MULTISPECIES: hypothetical protein [unclassified Nocardia]|uniref:hypothetical protein n=1 Tax=unclassified Nocardia TaxID=2637762 RepID=UPI0024A8E0D0|nr:MULTISPECIES: hypothetical protein [unclassified Nocardia]